MERTHRTVWTCTVYHWSIGIYSNCSVQWEKLRFTGWVDRRVSRGHAVLLGEDLMTDGWSWRLTGLDVLWDFNSRAVYWQESDFKIRVTINGGSSVCCNMYWNTGSTLICRDFFKLRKLTHKMWRKITNVPNSHLYYAIRSNPGRSSSTQVLLVQSTQYHKA